jgi:hypothetical protein
MCTKKRGPEEVSLVVVKEIQLLISDVHRRSNVSWSRVEDIVESP